jgi:hypothetical protein
MVTVVHLLNTGSFSFRAFRSGTEFLYLSGTAYTLLPNRGDIMNISPVVISRLSARSTDTGLSTSETAVPVLVEIEYP